ncbi:MAG: hypothetical protein RRZ92_04690, partial [Bacilli bacterium]
DTSNDSYQNNYVKTPNPSRKGEAIWETSASGTSANSWFSDYSGFPSTSGPWFFRGGHCHDGSNAGAFAFSDANGNASNNYGFRPVLLAF